MQAQSPHDGCPYIFHSSLRLFAMVNQPLNVPTGTPKSKNMTLLCMRANDLRFISTYMSPLDAVLGSKSLNNDDHFWPINFQCIDTSNSVQENGGWLQVAISYAYAADNDCLVVDEQGHPFMISTAERFHLTPEVMDHFTIQFSDHVAKKINHVYAKAGLHNFGATIDSMEKWTAEEIVHAEQEALDNMPPTVAYDEVAKPSFDQCAVYDPEEMEWIFFEIN